MRLVASFIRMPNESKAGVLQGTLDLMVLQTLATLGPLHGYAIGARIEQVSSGAIQLNMGTLYPGLMRLEQRGFIRAQWDRTETNRRARYYSITAAGRRQLQTEKTEWARMTAIMQAKLQGDEGAACCFGYCGGDGGEAFGIERTSWTKYESQG